MNTRRTTSTSSTTEDLADAVEKSLDGK